VVRHGGKLQGFFVRKRSEGLNYSASDLRGYELTESEIKRVAPNIQEKLYLLRPTPGFANPSLCTLHELRTIYTLNDLADFHEILNVREGGVSKARAESAKRSEQRNRGRR
jgi:hypothetical protein